MKTLRPVAGNFIKTLAQMFCWEFYETLRIIFFTEHLQTSASAALQVIWCITYFMPLIPL